MPKKVDHEKQKKVVSDAVLRIIKKHGLESASVRSIAKEARMSMGAMRYYFPSQDQLLLFILELLGAHHTERVGKLIYTGNRLQDIQLLLEQLLPLDEERRLENEVWLTFVLRAQRRSNLQDELVHYDAVVFQYYLTAVDALLPESITKQKKREEAEHLASFVDGMMTRHFTAPATVTPTRMRHMLQVHLRALSERYKDITVSP